jgi:hypothetical protein
MKGPPLLSLSFLIVCAVSLLGGCSTTRANPSDYAKSSNWLSLPSGGEKEVDVFYLYPTVWARTNDTDPIFSPLDNEDMRKGAERAFSAQASAFATVGNIYAPFYRQIDAAYGLSLSPEKLKEQLLSIPVLDAIAAFDYYLQHYNKGKPFILAGHSQGSDVLLFLLSSYMKDHPTVYSRMIAAYCIGCSVTEEYLRDNPHLCFAQGPDDLNVIVSYNTEALKTGGENPVVRPGSLAINPISWTRSEVREPKSENLGSAFLDQEGKLLFVPSFADAQVDAQRGVLLCTTVEGKLPTSVSSSLFPLGVYHCFDYPLYYLNIRENAEHRTRLFLGY